MNIILLNRTFPNFLIMFRIFAATSPTCTHPALPQPYLLAQHSLRLSLHLVFTATSPSCTHFQTAGPPFNLISTPPLHLSLHSIFDPHLAFLVPRYPPAPIFKLPAPPFSPTLSPSQVLSVICSTYLRHPLILFDVLFANRAPLVCFFSFIMEYKWWFYILFRFFLCGEHEEGLDGIHPWLLVFRCLFFWLQNVFIYFGCH